LGTICSATKTAAGCIPLANSQESGTAQQQQMRQCVCEFSRTRYYS
jgi:hypothetical protein